MTLHPYVAGGQVPVPETLSSDPLDELDAGAGNLAVVVAVGPLRRLLDTEPVRLWLYPVLVVVLALLTTYGLLSPDVSAAWLAACEALVGVGGWLVVETIRGLVVSPRTHRQQGDS